MATISVDAHRYAVVGKYWVNLPYLVNHGTPQIPHVRVRLAAKTAAGNEHKLLRVYVHRMIDKSALRHILPRHLTFWISVIPLC